MELEFYDVDGYCCLLQFPIHKKKYLQCPSALCEDKSLGLAFPAKNKGVFISIF